MKRAITILCGTIVIALVAIASESRAWQVDEPQNNSSCSRDADLAVSGSGAESTAIVVKFLIGTQLEDSFNVTTNGHDQGETPGVFVGEFDIGGQWQVGEHHVKITVGGFTVYPVGFNHVVTVDNGGA